MNRRIAPPLFTALGFAAVMVVAGAALAPQDVWPNVLLSGFFLAGVGLAGGFLIAVHDLSGGRWLEPLRSIAWSMTRLVLPGAALVLIAIIAGGSYLYPAWHEPPHAGFKAWWLGRVFFIVRAIGYAAAWSLALAILRRSRAAALFLVIFTVTVPLASFDWLMSLEPHWASTIYGLYHFAGLFTAGLAVAAIVAVVRSRRDASITSDHLHDVAKLLFAFSTFWMYIWFSQAMLIWYTNNPEETGWYEVRAFGNWGVLFWTTVALEWALPFFVLLPEKAKRNRTILLRIAVAVLIGHWLDLYVSIVPAHAAEPRLNGWELAIGLGTFAAVGWAVTRRDPRRDAPALEGVSAVEVPFDRYAAAYAPAATGQATRTE